MIIRCGTYSPLRIPHVHTLQYTRMNNFKRNYLWQSDGEIEGPELVDNIYSLGAYMSLPGCWRNITYILSRNPPKPAKVSSTPQTETFNLTHAETRGTYVRHCDTYVEGRIHTKKPPYIYISAYVTHKWPLHPLQSSKPKGIFEYTILNRHPTCPTGFQIGFRMLSLPNLTISSISNPKPSSSNHHGGLRCSSENSWNEARVLGYV